jgi:hypothetical protein
MRRYLVIVLIVCGTFLALASSAFDFIQDLEVAEALSKRSPAPSGFYRQPLEESYRIATWLLGGSMVGLALYVAGCQPNLRVTNNAAPVASTGSTNIRSATDYPRRPPGPQPGSCEMPRSLARTSSFFRNSVNCARIFGDV